LSSPKPTQATAIVLALTAALLWASSFIYIEVGLDDLEPITFAALRYLIGASTLVGYWVFRKGAANRTVTGRNAGLVVLLGVMLYTAVPVLQFVGLDQTEATTFNFVFQAGIPLVLALSAGMILKEDTSWWEWVGVAVVVGGAYVFFPARPEGADARGVALAGAAAVFIGGSNLIQRRVMRKEGTSALEVTTLSMAIGASLLTILALFVEDTPDLNLRLIGLLLVLGVLNTAVAFFIWHRALQTLRALQAGVIASLQIIAVPVMARWYLGEEFGTRRIVGSVIVLAGVAAVHISRTAAAARARRPVS